MDYYNLARLIKNVVYNFMRMFKYMSYCLIAICFIAVCLLLMSTHSKAETFYDNYNDKYVDLPSLDQFEGQEYCLLYNGEYNNYSVLCPQNFDTETMRYAVCNDGNPSWFGIQYNNGEDTSGPYFDCYNLDNNSWHFVDWYNKPRVLD